MRRHRVLASVVVGLLSLSMLLAGCGGKKKIEVIKVGSHTWNEPAILMEMVKLLIEQELPGQKVEHVKNIASTDLLQTSMEQGELMVYPSWTGTQLTGPLRQEVTPELRADPRKIFEYVRDETKKKWGEIIPEPLGFEDTYALIMRRDRAEQLGIVNVSDLAAHSKNLVIATDNDFQVREGDGYDDFKEWYGFEFKQAVSMDVGLMYRAVGTGDADVAMAYSTDGRIVEQDLVVLKDDKHFFPPYDTILVVSPKLYEAYPQLEKVINSLSGQITLDDMLQMNFRADVKQEDITVVAKDFLIAKGLLKK